MERYAENIKFIQKVIDINLVIQEVKFFIRVYYL